MHANRPGRPAPAARYEVSAWGPELSVGIDEIDQQHKELFERIDRLLRSMEERRGDDEIGRLLRFLETHVVLHFGTEEKLMVRTGYPGSKAHKGEHERFLADFSTIKDQFEAIGATPAVKQAVSSRICGWLGTHIRTVDRGLGRFLKSRPGEPSREATPPQSGPAPDRLPALVWSEDLSVGVALIDQQHQELFRRVNKLLAAAHKGLARHEVSGMIEFLGQYVIEHFDAEEAVMRASSYPDLSTHKAQHDAFKRELQKLTESLASSGANVSLVVEVNRTVCTWLTSHVRRSDKALGQFLIRRAGRPSGS